LDRRWGWLTAAELAQVILIETIGQWAMNLVPPIVARFVSPDQQNRMSSRIKGIQSSKWAALVLGAQLSHVRMP
jgi:hypothetical protein